MVDFICKGYIELPGTRVERELQNEKNLAHCGIEPDTFRIRNEGATTELRRLKSVERIKVHLVLTVLCLEIYLQHMVYAAKQFVVNYIL